MKSACVLTALLLVNVCAAQDFPARPVHLIVPYTPGTGAHHHERLQGTKLV